ncbi:MAG TPA: hypothetical protein VF041_03665 [Gemmatimonadaceae bacterium]
MRFLTNEEARARCGEIVGFDSAGWPLRPDREALYVRVPLPVLPDLTRFCQQLEHALRPREACLLWITDWGIWRSSENLHLCYRLRQSYGDRRLLDEAPAHLFGALVGWRRIGRRPASPTSSHGMRVPASRRDRFWRRSTDLLLGGVSFWAPVTLFELVTREFSLAVATLVPFAGELAIYLLAARRRRSDAAGLALWMLAGIFLLGPLFMSIGAAAFGGGFALPLQWRDLAYLVLLSLFPPGALMLAGYEGVVFGMVLSCVAMLAAYASRRFPET